jgi:hypothetical protein
VFDSPSVTDACNPAGVTLRIVSTTTNFTCGNSYIATRTWEATDACTNRIVCSQSVTVVDTTPPVVSCPPNRNVEFGNNWTFDSPSGTDACDGTAASLRIVSTVTNTAGMCGPGYHVTRTWELSDICSNKVNCSQTITVRDTTPPMLTCAANKIASCSLPWQFDAPSATDLADGTDVLITIVMSQTNGSCPGTFTALRAWRAEDRCGNFSMCTQAVMNTQATISGSLLYYPNSAQAIAGIGIHCNGSTNVTVPSGLDGSYSFNLNPGGTYTIKPVEPPLLPQDDCRLTAGVTTFDISLIRQHILNPTRRLDSAFKILAADVNGRSDVSTVDISMIRRFILGVSNTMPSGIWRFVPADHVFSNPDSPWDAPTSRVHSALSSSLSGQNFYAIKMGDVNTTWSLCTAGSMSGFNEPIAFSETEPSVTFAVSCHTNAPAEPVTVHVRVRDFTQVTSLQFTLEWDPTLLTYRSTGQYGLSGLGAANFGTTMTTSGKLVVSWDDPSALGITLPDGSAIFSVTLDVAAQMDCVARVRIAGNGSPVPPEVAINYNLANFNTENGHIVVMSGNAPAPELSGAGFQAGEFSVAVPTAAGRRYILEFTDSLSDSEWQALPAIQGDGTVKTLSDPSPQSQQRFYRVRVE